MDQEYLIESALLQDVSLSSRHYSDSDVTMLEDMKPPDTMLEDMRPPATTFFAEPQYEYPYQDFLGTHSSALMFPQQQVYTYHHQPQVLDDMFEIVEPLLPVVMAPESTTVLTEDELQTSPQEIMRMCLQDSASSDGYGFPTTPATPASSADHTVSSTMDLLDLPAANGAKMCTMCYSAFPTKASLSRHWRQAHRPRVWHVCDVCGKSLATVYSLRKHKLRHTGLKPFSCTHCGRGFYEKNALCAHERNKHPPSAADISRDIKDVVMDVGLQVVHQQGGVEGGGVVFKRSADGEVVGIVATPRAVAPPTWQQEQDHQGGDGECSPDQAGDEGIVLRLARCKSQDGAWKVVNITKY